MAKDLSDLPDELQGRAEPARKKREPIAESVRADRLVALGQLIAQKRDEAIKARKESGIEEVWMACEDAYLGIDDANRGEFEKAKWAKSTTMAGPLTRTNVQPSGNKSTAFVRLTTRYVDMGAAKISEICLPIDDKAFAFDNSPVPELVKASKDKTPLVVNGMQGFKPAEEAQPGQPAPAAVPGAPPGMVPATVKDAAAVKLDAASKAAKKAEARIYDWMVESRYPMQMRKVIHDAARIGVGVLKGPFPDERTAKAYTVTEGKGTLEIIKSISPACKWIDTWNLFPHGVCGEDIHEGDHILERDFLSAASLKKLKNLRGMKTDEFPDGEPIYIASQIDKVIAEGPGKCNVNEGRNPNQPENKHRFDIWHFTGTLNAEDMMALGAPGADELPDEVTECYAIVTIVNDSPIRATFNPLEKSGHFPYRAFPWSRRAGHWAGVGVGEQVAMPQRMVNAGTRGWMNNAGMTAGVQIVMDQRAIIGADGNNDLTPNKMWYLTGEGVSDDVRKMFMAVDFPDRATTLKDIIDYAFKLAEEASNIPLISQGQTGPQDPQTFGQAELQNNNANTLLRDKAYSLDDYITEPMVNDFYEWLLLDPDIPIEEKGDFRINARGSIAMVEKAIQEQTLAQMLPLTLNPIWGQDPKKVFAEFLRSKRMNPATTAYTDEEIAKLQGQPPPETPAEKVAKINAATKLHAQEMGDKTRVAIAQGHDQVIVQKSKDDIDRDAEYVRAETERTRAEHEGRIQMLSMQREIAILKMMNDRGMSLDDAKASLAKTAMEIRAQVQLSVGGNQAAPQVAEPAFEPPARAQDGHAYEQ